MNDCFNPRLFSARRSQSFHSRRHTGVRYNGTQHGAPQQHNRKDKKPKQKGKPDGLMLVPHALGEIQLSSVLNFLTPLPWADVSTGKLDFRFPAQPSLRLSKQFQAVWNTNHLMTKSEDFQKFPNQTGSHPNVNNQLAQLYKLVKNEVIYKFLYTLIFQLFTILHHEKDFSWFPLPETSVSKSSQTSSLIQL